MQTRNIRLDSIEFRQDTAYPDQIAGIFSKIDLDDLYTKHTHLTDISDIIKKHTGLTVNLNIEAGYTAYVLVHQMTSEHVYSDIDTLSPTHRYQLMKGILSYISASGKFTINYDTSTDKFYGDVSKIPYNVYLGKVLLRHMTPNQRTAILLHEIGHIVGYLKMIDRSNRISFIMEEVARKILDVPDSNKRYQLISNAAKSIYPDYPMPEYSDSASYNNEVAKTIIVDAEYKAAESIFTKDPYSYRGFEQIADVYVCRLQYGVHLATALDKLSRYDESDSIHTFKMIASKMASEFNSPISPFLPSLINRDMDRGIYEKIYDPTHIRLERIAIEINKFLKNRSNQQELIRSSLKDLEIVKGIIAKKEKEVPYLEVLAESMHPDAKEFKNTEEFQRSIDRLSGNALFAIASKLNTPESN